MNKKCFIAVMIIIGMISLTDGAFAQENKSGNVGQPEDTLNTKIENLKSDFSLLKKIRFSGYIQAQWQLADSAGQLSPFSGGNFPDNSNNRFMLRRGRIKVAYNGKLSQAVIQIDATEKGVSLKDAYLNLTDPWLEMFTIQGGVYKIPFGYEIGMSSSVRESPERARVIQTLFPGERDLGAMLTIQPSEDSRFRFIRLNAAIINGNGVAPEDDSRKDFTGQLGVNRTTKNEKFKYGLGISYYYGGVYQETKNIYNMTTLEDGIAKGFVVDSSETNLGGYAKREYFGADAQFSLDWVFGKSTLRGEYIWGSQPGSNKSNVSPVKRSIPDNGVMDTYKRKFSGGYVYFIQNILDSKHEIVIKYDYLDPNKDVKGKDAMSEFMSDDNMVKTGLGPADIAYNAWGFGYNFKVHSNVKLSAFYELVKNESTGITGFSNNIKDNVFTLRVQVKY